MFDLSGQKVQLPFDDALHERRAHESSAFSSGTEFALQLALPKHVAALSKQEHDVVAFTQ
jgi:hypothetical protein